MKYCKKCGVLYSGLLESCPKCNALLEEHIPEEAPPPEASKKTKIKQWIGICIGIPALVALLYIIGYFVSGVS